MMSFCAPDAVLKLMGMGTSFDGVSAIRGFCEDWFAAYQELAVEREEILDLGQRSWVCRDPAHRTPGGRS